MNHTDKFERFSGNTIADQGLKEKSVRAALFMATGKGADLILRLISTVILARLLIPEHFGLVGMVMAVIGMGEVVKGLGLSSATIQRNDISHAQVSNLFWVNATAGIIFFLFFAAISIPIAEFYSDKILIPITIALSTNFIWSGLIVQHEALLERQLKQGQISLIRLSANLLSILAAVLLAIGGYEYWALVWREVSRHLVIAGGIWLFCPWIPGLPMRNTGLEGCSDSVEI